MWSPWRASWVEKWGSSLLKRPTMKPEELRDILDRLDLMQMELSRFLDVALRDYAFHTPRRSRAHVSAARTIAPRHRTKSSKLACRAGCGIGSPIFVAAKLLIATSRSADRGKIRVALSALKHKRYYSSSAPWPVCPKRSAPTGRKLISTRWCGRCPRQG